jgi:hypothetical protein
LDAFPVRFEFVFLDASNHYSPSHAQSTSLQHVKD